MKYSSNNSAHHQEFIAAFLSLFSFLRVSINKCQGIAKSTKILGGGIKNTQICESLDVTLIGCDSKVFIEHCQICKLHGDGHNVCIMPFLCVTIDVKSYIVFENVKLRTLLTFYGLAHYITARNI